MIVDWRRKRLTFGLHCDRILLCFGTAGVVGGVWAFAVYTFRRWSFCWDVSFSGATALACFMTSRAFHAARRMSAVQAAVAPALAKLALSWSLPVMVLNLPGDASTADIFVVLVELLYVNVFVEVYEMNCLGLLGAWHDRSDFDSREFVFVELLQDVVGIPVDVEVLQDEDRDFVDVFSEGMEWNLLVLQDLLHFGFDF